MKPSVLVVDDEPNIVVSLEFLMKQAGYDVRV
ncbi:MAG: two-component system response regulator, partial [Alphaproteobacteria bacterium]